MGKQWGHIVAMKETPILSHALRRIADCPHVQNRYSRHLADDHPDCRQLARPLFDAGLYSAGITQRSSNDSLSHVVADYRFTLLLRGTMHCRFGDEEHLMLPGDLCCCPPGILYRRWSKQTTWFVYFDFSAHKVWQPLKKHGPYIREHPAPDVIFVLLRQLIDLHDGLYHGNPTAAEHSERLAKETPQGVEYAALLLSMLRRECTAVRELTGGPVDRLHALVRQIHLSPETAWDLENMSQYIHVSGSTLGRLTQSEYGLSPLQLVIRARMEEAVRCLENPANTIMDIADRLGYKSTYSFSRLFARHMGMAPGKYRDTVLKKKAQVSP